MSALSQFAVRRAKRIIRPYRENCQPPKKTRMATLTRIVSKLQPPSDLKGRLEFAHHVGYFRGLNDKHEEPRNFQTGAEWLSWLAGWRTGQAELKAQRDAERRRLEQIEESMMEERF